MTLDSALLEFIANGFLIWLSGYGVGIIWRHFRQVMEKATRGA